MCKYTVAGIGWHDTGPEDLIFIVFIMVHREIKRSEKKKNINEDVNTNYKIYKAIDNTSQCTFV